MSGANAAARIDVAAAARDAALKHLDADNPAERPAVCKLREQRASTDEAAFIELNECAKTSLQRRDRVG
jgi:hypothetical protein